MDLGQELIHNDPRMSGQEQLRNGPRYFSYDFGRYIENIDNRDARANGFSWNKPGDITENQ